MKRHKGKKAAAILAVLVLILSLAACGNSKDSDSSSEDKSGAAEQTMTIDKDKKEVSMLCEVNGTYFTEPTRHGIVFKDGSNGEKAILRGLADEKDFHQALLDIGATPGNNLTDEDMEAGADNGKSIEGDKLDVFIKWDGQEEIPFQDIIKCTKDYKMDIRFGGNIESAKKYNTGCILCLDSCSAGITSDTAWPTGTTQNNVAEFYGDDSVLPADATQVTVTFRLAQ